jgi:hypothetical protein
MVLSKYTFSILVKLAVEPRKLKPPKVPILKAGIKKVIDIPKCDILRIDISVTSFILCMKKLDTSGHRSTLSNKTHPTARGAK